MFNLVFFFLICKIGSGRLSRKNQTGPDQLKPCRPVKFRLEIVSVKYIK